MGGKSKSKTQKVEVQPWPEIIPYITGPQGVLPEAQRLYLESLQMSPQIRGLQQQFIRTIGQSLPYYDLMNKYYLDLFKRLVAGRYNFDPLGFLNKFYGRHYSQIPTPEIASRDFGDIPITLNAIRK